MIYKCLPEKVNRIWGSLPSEKNDGEPVGEIWWFAADTILENIDGRHKAAADFFPLGSFPIIIKTLHASTDLSVQVHPGRDRTIPMKDESWVVLEGNGKIMHGALDGTTPHQFKNAVEDGSVETLLRTIRGKAGVFVDLPAGTIHALGAGLTVLEVQINCNITYRLWDYARKDMNGNLRDLHIEQGLAAINWDNMGRATEVTADFLETDYYFMKKISAGRIELSPLEIIFLPEMQECFFADTEGGIISTNCDSWIIGAKQ